MERSQKYIKCKKAENTVVYISVKNIHLYMVVSA